MIYLFDAELWVWDARKTDTWMFVRLPEEESREIRELAGSVPRGFGSVRVTATIGATVWKTSIFPDAKAGVYALPLKKAVRAAEGLAPGDVATVRIELEV